MIDLLAIVLSCFAVLLIVARAIRLDARLPWYGVPAQKPAELRAGPSRRRGGPAPEGPRRPAASPPVRSRS